MSALFQPLSIRSVMLKNRLVVSPMCQYSSVDGYCNSWHMVHLGSRAVGGAGLVFTEATAVSPEGRITPDDLGLWKDDHIAGLRQITDFITENGAVPGIQLAHAGRKASHYAPWKGGAALSAEDGAWTTYAPSAVAFKAGEPLPVAMNKADIEKVIKDFRLAAARAWKAGFKVIEIHGAHGYLIHEFLSPLSNQRTDEYGGPFEHRVRLLLEIIAAVKEVWPDDLPLVVRISATDWAPGGWTADDSVALAKVLKEAGADLVDCSTGGNIGKVQIPVGPLYQVPFAARVKKEADILTGAVGLITTAMEAEEIIRTGKADLVFMARELLRDPCFPLHAATQLGADVKWPLQYERARPS